MHNHQALHQQVHDFMGSLRYAPPQHTVPGAALLELYAAFDLRRGACSEHEAEQQEGSAKTSMSIREGLHKFKDMVKYIVETCVQQDDKLLFSAAKAQTWRLLRSHFGSRLPSDRPRS